MKLLISRLAAVAVGLVALTPASGSAEQAVGLRVPDGFEVTHFADADLANDIYCMTVDSQGRVAVAGRGYVRILIDRDGNGLADEARQFSDLPASGAQGIYFDGNDLLCTGDGAILRFRDADGDGRADGPPERLLEVKTGGEHHTHAIRKGPDGWWYVLAGNHAGVDSHFASLATSPIRRPSAGVLYRLTPDFKGSEIVADGFRNAYDFDFSAVGDVVVYDSDGERYVSLPWYQPTRVFHALPGSNAGWMSLCWIRPDYYLDMPPVIGRFGRGSPTGVECYRHEQFPPEYHGAAFIADWTFGRVITLPLAADGSTYTSEPIEFMTGLGTFGFAPTDLAVGPDGSLFVSVGGRGTRGSVYRVRHVGDWQKDSTAEADDALTKCLSAPQPLSSWSRAAWEPLAAQLGREAIASAALGDARTSAERMRAIEVLVERFGGPTTDELLELSGAGSPNVRARVAWSLRHASALRSERRSEVVAAFLHDQDPLTTRLALEALLGEDPLGEVPTVREAIAEALDSDDRYVRQTAARVASEWPADALAAVVEATQRQSARSQVAALYAASLAGRIDRAAALRFAAETVADASLDKRIRLDAARIAQLALGDVGGGAGLPEVFEGYSGPLSQRKWSRDVRDALRMLAAAYPTGAGQVDYELTRALALAGYEDSDLLGRVLDTIEPASDPVDDIHHLIVAARIPAPRTREHRDAIAAALLGIDAKIRRAGLHQDLHWEPRLAELYARLVELDAGLPAGLAARPEFGAGGSVLFLDRMPRRVRMTALDRIADRARTDEDYPWSSDLVFALAESGRAEHHELLRGRADELRVRQAVTIALARRGAPVDHPLFVAGLDSATYEVLESCLAAIERLPASDDPGELVALAKLVRRLGADRRDIALRDRAVRLLRRNTGMDFGYVFESDDPQAGVIAQWAEWIGERHPEAATELLGGRAGERDSLLRQLEETDWTAGDVKRGEKLFADRSCAQCHSGRGAAGPDLAGVTKRFSRADILMAIVVPNRDVSSRYATRTIETTSGRTHTGLVIYESVDGVTLRDALNQTIRIEADEIESMREVTVSLMPTGLLDGLSPQDVADLFAYLETL